MSGCTDAAHQTRIDMENARENTTVDVAQIRNLLHNTPGEWQKRDRIVQALQKDHVFGKESREFMTRSERYKRSLAMTNRIYELQEIHHWSDEEVSIAFASLGEPLPIDLHNVAFAPVFNLQASPTLHKAYFPLIQCRAILGCYLQTELGHGSDVSQLETTSTYLPSTQEFEIHSPTLTSYKWWIGALGNTATHGVVQAKLVLPGGKDMGPHLFFVQLRDMDTHRSLPGITMGDIGPKALGGFSSIDNGFARFDHIRIPKEHMLSKFAQVTDEGEYRQPPHAKISYGGMLYIRANMVTTAGRLMAKAATISIRYATVRRQGSPDPANAKLQLQTIQYPSVYTRLLPILSHAYVFIQLGKTLLRSFTKMSRLMSKGDASLLPSMHAITSGLKVLSSTISVHDLEVARRSMGGHGFSAWAGLGRIYADHLPSVTYEGDNFVLDQQVVRSALKSLTSLLASPPPSPETLPPSAQYLRLLLGPQPPSVLGSDSSWDDPAKAISLLEWRAALVMREHASNVEEGSSLDGSVNQRVSKAVTEAFVAVEVGDMIRDLRDGRDSGVLRALYLLYLLTTLESALTDLLSFGLLTPARTTAGIGRDPARSLRLAVDEICREILPNAIGLSDAFGFSDWELDSALGVYDGGVYDALWERTKLEPMNQTEVTEAYEESIKPILLRGRTQVAQGRIGGVKL